ncbi:Chlororespiratory reduction 2 [Balamuthia mandrillaris]
MKTASTGTRRERGPPGSRSGEEGVGGDGQGRGESGGEGPLGPVETVQAGENLKASQRVHSHLLHLSTSDQEVLSRLAVSLISVYGACGRLDLAREVFHHHRQQQQEQQQQERGKGEKGGAVIWNAMMQACTQCGNGKEALQLFQEMEEADVPADAFTFSIVLKACGIMTYVETGKRVHAEVLRRGLQANVVLCNALINMYGTCERMEARAVFQGMKERNVVTWNTMIAAASQSGHGQEALQLFQEMQQAGVAADAFTFAAVLKACASTADLKTGKRVHAELLRRSLLPNAVLSTALIDMYGKCGELEEACKVFQQMKERDVITWNAMIAVHGLHGQGKAALAALQEMQEQGVQPDAITFINVLNACSHAGLVEEGLACFAAMREKHNIRPTTAFHLHGGPVGAGRQAGGGRSLDPHHGGPS